VHFNAEKAKKSARVDRSEANEEAEKAKSDFDAIKEEYDRLAAGGFGTVAAAGTFSAATLFADMGLVFTAAAATGFVSYMYLCADPETGEKHTEAAGEKQGTSSSMSLRGVAQAVGYAASKVVSKSSAWSTFNAAKEKVEKTAKRARDTESDYDSKKQKVDKLEFEFPPCIEPLSPPPCLRP
jgi:hypothetical protein